MAQNVLVLTVGEMGCGKSARRGAHYLLHEFLKDEVGVHYSNININIDAMAKEAKRLYKIPEAVTRSRIVRIPHEEVSTWMDDVGELPDNARGIWSYFKENGINPNGAHIALDEAHNYIPSTGNVGNRKKWMKYIAELRHMGCTLELITQNVDNLEKKIVKLAGIRLEIRNRINDRDPFFHIRMEDWYNLKACYVGEWQPKNVELEKVKEFQNRSVVWVTQKETFFKLCSNLYKLYDSYQKPEHDEEGTSGRKKYLYELKGFRGTHWWFFTRNFHHFLKIGSMVVLFFWLCVFGGLPFLMNTVIDAGSSAIGVSAQELGDTGEIQTDSEGVPLLETAEHVKEYFVEYDIDPVQLYHDMQELENRIIEIEAQEKDTSQRVVALFSNSVVTGDGKEYLIGEQILIKGEYYEINNIDLHARCFISVRGERVYIDKPESKKHRALPNLEQSIQDTKRKASQQIKQ